MEDSHIPNILNLTFTSTTSSFLTTTKEPSDSKVSSGSMNSIKEEDGKFSRRLSFIDCSTAPWHEGLEFLHVQYQTMSNLYPIGSMGLVYFPYVCLIFYGFRVVKYTIHQRKVLDFLGSWIWCRAQEDLDDHFKVVGANVLKKWATKKTTSPYGFHESSWARFSWWDPYTVMVYENSPGI